MFNQYQVEDISNHFTLEEINTGINKLDYHVERQWLGSYEEAESLGYFDLPVPRIVEMEGFWVIPMGQDGVAFDYGDTSSGGVCLVDCLPFGNSKEQFKKQLLENLLAIKNILELKQSS